MDALCTPTILTAALFIALMILDLFRHDYNLLPGHGLFGFFSVLVMAALCQYGYKFFAWTFFLLPFVLLIVGWAIGAQLHPSLHL